MARIGVDGLDLRPRARRVPPVVPEHLARPDAPPAQSSTAARPASLPPWPFTNRNRRKPWTCSDVEQVTEHGAVGLPRGASGCPGTRRSTASGRTGAPEAPGRRAAAPASTDTRSARIRSTPSERYPCCSTEPSGTRSDRPRARYSSTCIQLQSSILIAVSPRRRAATESSRSSSPARGGELQPAGKVPSAIPQGSETAGMPARL